VIFRRTTENTSDWKVILASSVSRQSCYGDFAEDFSINQVLFSVGLPSTNDLNGGNL